MKTTPQKGFPACNKTTSTEAPREILSNTLRSVHNTKTLWRCPVSITIKSKISAMTLLLDCKVKITVNSFATGGRSNTSTHTVINVLIKDCLRPKSWWIHKYSNKRLGGFTNHSSFMFFSPTVLVMSVYLFICSSCHCVHFLCASCFILDVCVCSKFSKHHESFLVS